MPEDIIVNVTIKADTSGAQEIASALEGMKGAAGGASDAVGGAGDAIAQMGNQAIEASRAVVPFGGAAADAFESIAQGQPVVTESTDALGNHQQALLDTGEAYKALQEPVGTAVALLGEASPQMQQITQRAQELSTQITPVAEGFTQIQGAMEQIALPQFADSLHQVSEAFDPKQFGLDTFAENMSVFQDALSNPYPFSMINSYLGETGQAWSDFTSSIGGENVAALHDMALGTMGTSTGSAAQQFMQYIDAQMQATSSQGDFNATTTQASENMANFGAETGAASKSTGAFTDNVQATQSAMNEFNQSDPWTGFTAGAQDASKTVADVTSGMNQLGGVGPSQYGPQTFFESLGISASDAQKGMAQMGLTEESKGLGGIFSNVGAELGNAMMGIDTIMRPMMYLQMAGMAVSAVATGIYNAAAIAEGPGAHSMGTFTGTVDALAQSAQQAGQTFSESFGQQLMPTLNAMNYAMNQGGSSGGIGGTLGGVGSFLANTGLLLAGGLALTAPGMQGIGMSMITTGGEGMINQGASAIGLPQPFQGPGPQAQAQISYDQQMAQLPQTVAAQTLQSQASAATLTAEAMSPAYLQAQDNASAAQQLLQRQQANYDAGHPVSPQSLIQGNLQQQYTQSEIQAMQNQPTYAQDVGSEIQQGNWGAVGHTIQQASGLATFMGELGQAFQGSPIGQDFSQMFSGTGQTLGGIGSFFGAIGQGFNNLLNAGGGQVGSTGTAGGCFIAGTPVLMADGTTKPIEALQVGDQVLGCEGVKQFPATILDRIIFPAKQTYKLTFSDGRTLTLTDSHPLCSPLEGWKSLSPESAKRENPGLPTTTLVVGNLLYTVDGVRSLISIEKKQIEQVFNITVNGPHTYYANGVLVHNAKTDASGVGTEQVVSHTFRADVTWEANNLTKQFTAAATWAAQNLEHTVTAIAQWAEQNVQHAITAVATWAEQNVIHPVVAVAEWAEQNVMHAVTAVAQWADQNLIHPVVAIAQWAAENLEHTATMVGSWVEKNMEHLFTGVASWIGQNLSHTFVGIAQWITQTITSVIPGFAEGVSNYEGGPAVVGEAGSEAIAYNGGYALVTGPTFVNLPSGSSVYPMQELSTTPRMLANGTGGDITPISLPIIGTTGGNSGMQTANISVYLDSMVLAQALGVSLSQNIRIGMGMRGY